MFCCAIAYTSNDLAGLHCVAYIFREVTDPGRLVVTCALPTKKEQCKNGGWRDFGVFENQGDCVSFVATGGRNLPAGEPTVWATLLDSTPDGV
jgi:hypothetical protein